MTRYEALAREFHDAYERLAPEFGYKTREASAVPWEDVPEQNKALMMATVEHVMAGAVKALELIASRYDWDASACPKIAHAALVEMGLRPSTTGGR